MRLFSFVVMLVVGILFLIAGCTGTGNISVSEEGTIRGQARAMLPASFRGDETVPLAEAEVVVINVQNGEIVTVGNTDLSGLFDLSVSPGGPYKVAISIGNVQVSVIVENILPGEAVSAGVVDAYSTAVTLVFEEALKQGIDLDIEKIEENAGQQVAELAQKIAQNHQDGENAHEDATVKGGVENLLNFLFKEGGPTPFQDDGPPGPPAGIPPSQAGETEENNDSEND